MERIDQAAKEFLEWKEEGIKDALYDLREWMVEDWLENHGHEHSNNEDQYYRYRGLEKALDILNEKEKEKTLSLYLRTFSRARR